jgi:hypothetical protein
MRRIWKIVLVMGAGALLFAACGGDDDAQADSAATEQSDAETDTSEAGGDESAPVTEEPAPDEDDTDVSPPAASGSAGTLVLGDETITFDRSRCFLEEQDAAAGGGKILFVVQAFGSNGEGEEVLVDISRFDEDSQFEGDEISVVIGDPFSGDAVSFDGGGEIGTVTIEGSTASAPVLTFTDSNLVEIEGSLVVAC